MQITKAMWTQETVDFEMGTRPDHVHQQADQPGILAQCATRFVESSHDVELPFRHRLAQEIDHAGAVGCNTKQSFRNHPFSPGPLLRCNQG